MKREACWIGLLAVLSIAAATPLSAGGEDFIRGDANQDGVLDLSDGILVLNFLMGGFGPPCPDAADANDNGTINIVDAVHILHVLFVGDATPWPPHPDCGADPSPDVLDCPVSVCP